MNSFNPKNLMLLGLIALFLFPVFSVQAQLIDFDKIGKRTKRKAERKAERKVEDKIDDALDGIFNKKKKKGEEEDEAYDATDEEEYTYEVDDSPVVPNSFIGSYTMEMNTYKKGKLLKDASSTTSLTFDTYKTAFQPQTDDGSMLTLIIDNQAKTITSLQEEDGEKKGYRMAKPKMTVAENKPSATEVSVKKTAQTKTIEGYLCYKYLITSDEFRTTAWITEEIQVDMPFLPGKAFANVKIQQPKAYQDVKGMMLESFTVDNEGYEIKTLIKNLEVGVIDVSIFDTSAYDIIDMEGMTPYQGRN